MEEQKRKMPTVWFALKRSFQCKSEPSEVYDPKRKGSSAGVAAAGGAAGILTRKMGRSGCSRSIANLKDVVIHSSKRHLERPPSCSPRSIGSSEFINPIAHEVILNSSTCELKITGYGGAADFRGPSPRKTALSDAAAAAAAPAPRTAKKADPVSRGSSASTLGCHKCGEKFGKWDAMEAHHLAKHAVTELGEGDSSRKIVEIICRSSWLKGESACGGIERVLKVHNTQKTLARFEEHREAVKQRAGKLPKKHPRCLADGNELLRFHGATVACPLGVGGSSSLCVSENCRVCRIIRHGFSPAPETGGGIGVFTTSTSGRALESIAGGGEERKALLLCRVIAGRVHRPVEDLRALPPLAGFDSLAGKVGLHANIEELHLLSPRALLPCFVVICRP